MPTMPVDEFRRKLLLLRTYSAHRSLDDIAKQFGVPIGTLKYWGHGSARRAPDRLPEWALPVLSNLFAAILSPNRSPEDIHRLVLGPAALLEEQVRSGAGSSLSALIAREGKTGTALLFRKSEEGNLVEIEGEAGAPDIPRLGLDARFRIEFPVDRIDS